MIGPGTGTRIWIAAGVTDMRRGMDGLLSAADVK
jgi:transposase